MENACPGWSECLNECAPKGPINTHGGDVEEQEDAFPLEFIYIPSIGLVLILSCIGVCVYRRFGRLLRSSQCPQTNDRKTGDAAGKRTRHPVSGHVRGTFSHAGNQAIKLKRPRAWPLLGCARGGSAREPEVSHKRAPLGSDVVRQEIDCGGLLQQIGHPPAAHSKERDGWAASCLTEDSQLPTPACEEEEVKKENDDMDQNEEEKGEEGEEIEDDKEEEKQGKEKDAVGDGCAGSVARCGTLWKYIRNGTKSQPTLGPLPEKVEASYVPAADAIGEVCVAVTPGGHDASSQATHHHDMICKDADAVGRGTTTDAQQPHDIESPELDEGAAYACVELGADCVPHHLDQLSHDTEHEQHTNKADITAGRQQRSLGEEAIPERAAAEMSTTDETDAQKNSIVRSRVPSIRSWRPTLPWLLRRFWFNKTPERCSDVAGSYGKQPGVDALRNEGITDEISPAPPHPEEGATGSVGTLPEERACKEGLSEPKRSGAATGGCVNSDPCDLDPSVVDTVTKLCTRIGELELRRMSPAGRVLESAPYLAPSVAEKIQNLAGRITELEHEGAERRGEHERSHMGTTAFANFLPGDLGSSGVGAFTKVCSPIGKVERGRLGDSEPTSGVAPPFGPSVAEKINGLVSRIAELERGGTNTNIASMPSLSHITQPPPALAVYHLPGGNPQQIQLAPQDLAAGWPTRVGAWEPRPAAASMFPAGRALYAPTIYGATTVATALPSGSAKPLPSAPAQVSPAVYDQKWHDPDWGTVTAEDRGKEECSRLPMVHHSRCRVPESLGVAVGIGSG